MAFRFPEKSSQHTAELCGLAPRASPGRAPSGGCHARVREGASSPACAGGELSIMWRKPGKKVQKPLPSVSDTDSSRGPQGPARAVNLPSGAAEGGASRCRCVALTASFLSSFLKMAFYVDDLELAEKLLK